VNQIKFTIEVG